MFRLIVKQRGKVSVEQGVSWKKVSVGQGVSWKKVYPRIYINIHILYRKKNRKKKKKAGGVTKCRGEFQGKTQGKDRGKIEKLLS